MKRIFLLISLIYSVLPNVVHADAQMGNYCSAPPYVTRNVAPNIMIVMDNSSDMYNPAYPATDPDDPTKTYVHTKTYPGYFTPNSCYAYGSNRFYEVYKSGYTSYTASDDCPSTAPYRGNLLNWATTSKYDLLEKILVGGQADSRQANTNQVTSSSGSWAKTYNGCTFTVESNNLTISDTTAGSCSLLNSTPTAVANLNQSAISRFIAWLTSGFDRVYTAFAGSAKAVIAYCSKALVGFGEVATATAEGTYSITPAGSPMYFGQQGSIVFTAACTGQGCGNPTYTWTNNFPDGKPSWLSGPTYTDSQKNTIMQFSGTPPVTATSFRITASAQITQGNTTTTVQTVTYTVNVSVQSALSITTSAIPGGTENSVYSAQMSASGGAGNYTWSASGLPSGLSINSSTGIISGTPANNSSSGSPYSFTVYVTDATGTTVSTTYTFAVAKSDSGGSSSGIRSSQAMSVVLEYYAETVTNDVNENQIWDTGDTFTDTNTDGIWQGKQGIVQKFWDERPAYIKARWGVTDFDSSLNPKQTACIPATQHTSLYSAIQNAVGRNGLGSISDALFSAVNLYENTGNYYSNSCGNPIDALACRKNFVLIISSGANVTGSNYFPSATCTTVPNGNSTAPLVQTACYGLSSAPHKVYTYIVNAMGTNTANNNVMQDAASAGGGKYYDVRDPAQLESQLTQAFTDILAAAASGTAVSVLTTSSRGSGSMIQSYFLPNRHDGTRDVWWTGYTQNLWIDPQDNLREDTVNDYQLALNQDNVLKLYFDPTSNQTMAATFTTLADGTGGTLASCSSPAIKPFSSVTYLWEAGKKLAAMAPSTRTMFTSTNIIRTSGVSPISTTTTTIPTKDFTVSNITGATTLTNALNPDATYSAENIVRYVRGECLETGVTGDTACGNTVSSVFRDRRITNPANNSLQVWKLGDVISSTPKVFSNTPLNTYHIDYEDGTYYSYLTSTDYTRKSAVAFVGANDGILHAFRVGYMKTSGLLSGIIALFQNIFGNAQTTDKLGEEIWGFIPFNAFPYLKYLADTSYCHLYYNDLSVRLVDASIGDSSASPTATKSQSSWRTILIGGMRFGGAPAGGTPAPPTGVSNVGFSAFYALDITDPEHPVPLWEFSDDDMGYATTYPAVIRTGSASENGNWYVVIGSGSTVLPKSQTDIGRSTNGYIYILNLKTGALVKKINLGGNAIVGDILSIDANKDYKPEKVYFGTSYLSGGTWHGQLIGLSIPDDMTSLCGTGVGMSYSNCTSGSTRALTTLFDDIYPFTASPDSTKDTDGNIWVYAGSGKYYSDVDESDTSNQIFLGLKDIPGATYYPLSKSNLDDRTSSATTGVVTSTSQVCAYNSSTNSFGFQTYVNSITPTSSSVPPSDKGWVYALAAPERVISRPLAVGGIVDFLTYLPSSDPCSYGGDSYLYSLGYTTGVAPSNISIHAPGITTGTSNTVTVHSGVLLGPGAPPTGEAIIIPPPKEGLATLKKKIQVSTGVIVEAENQPVINVVSKILHWLKK